MDSNITVVNQQGAIAAHSVSCFGGLDIRGALTVGASSTVWGPLQIEGSLTVQSSSTLTAMAGAGISGQVHLGASSFLSVYNGSSALQDQSQIDGAGWFILASGGLTVAGGASVQNVSCGTGISLAGSGTLTVAGTMILRAASLTDSGTLNIGQNAVLNLS